MKPGAGALIVIQLMILLESSLIITAVNGQSAPQSAYNRCNLLGEQSNSSRLTLNCILAPSDDAYVENLAPSQNFGDLPLLIVQETPSIPTLRDYTYLKFDLANAIPSQLIQSHANPVNASLSMYVELINFFYNATIQVHLVKTSNWNEHSITWDNQPSYDSSFAQTTIRMNGTWTHWNVTSDLVGSADNSTEISFAVIPSSRSWKNQVWFASKEFPLNIGPRWPKLQLTYTEPYLTIMTPFPNLSLIVDDSTFQTDANGVFQAPFTWGAHHVRIPDALLSGNGTRMGFRGWSDNNTQNDRIITLGNNLTLRVSYQKEFMLQTSSPYGSMTGSGWYFKDSTVNVSVQPTVVPFSGWLGLLGARHVFDHFAEACETSEPTCSVRMDNAKVVIAIWRDDYTVPVLLALVIIGFATFAELILRPSRKRRRGQ